MYILQNVLGISKMRSLLDTSMQLTSPPPFHAGSEAGGHPELLLAYTYVQGGKRITVQSNVVQGAT